MTRGDWIEVTHRDALSRALRAELTDAEATAVHSVMSALTHRESYWLVERDFPRRRPDDHMMNLEVLRTRIFFNWTECKKLGSDIVIFAVVYLSTQNLPLAMMLGLAKKLWDTVQILSEDERELVRTIMAIAAPASAYEAPVPEEKVKAAYSDATLDVDALLDSLQTKKILRIDRRSRIKLEV